MATTARQRPAAVVLTPAAEARIAALMAKAPADAIGVKLSTPRRGCSGLAYSVDYVTEADRFDERIVSVSFFQGRRLDQIISLHFQLTSLGAVLACVVSRCVTPLSIVNLQWELSAAHVSFPFVWSCATAGLSPCAKGRRGEMWAV